MRAQERIDHRGHGFNGEGSRPLPPGVSGAKILIVDDEPANLQKLRRTFVNRYQVLAAGSGAQALELLQQNEDIAVVIADQRMPDMTGVDLLRRTTVLLPHAIRIILTGYTDVDVLVEAINTCKVYRYIVKPWDPPDLLMTVERGLEARTLVLENERFRRELIRRERLARELEIAREIQRYILPPECPRVGGYEMAVEYHPAREVGGDLYDFHWEPSTGLLQLVIGDVSGKSIPAALYGAVFSGQMRSLFAHPRPPSEMLAFLNASLIAGYRVSNYIAVCVLLLDSVGGRMQLANGGMPFPYLVRDGDVSQVDLGGVPLGLLEGESYLETEILLREGDTLVLISDGVTDAQRPDGEMYGFERFEESLRRSVAHSMEACVRSLYQEVSDFIRTAEIHDDITIVGLRRTA
ncbi:MAG: response regulator [Acidobacteria bacterium]|nr:response regulator [Acidobacteriota bacterium]